MNTQTGEIKDWIELTEKQRKFDEWLEVSKKHMENMSGMNRKQRRQYLRENGLFSKGRWGWEWI